MKQLFSGVLTLLFLSVNSTAMAHFGMVIPSTNIITQDQKEVDMQLSFSHPFEMIGMDMAKPEKFYVVHGGATEDLLQTLKPATIMDHGAWSTTHRVRRPGVYHFVMEPEPYWEPAEDLFIIHYTKTIVAAFGENQGWDSPVGLPTEIVPLTRPYGNYAGNSFSGQVLIASLPAADIEVEVEFYNPSNTLKNPSSYHITQQVKTDNNGVFTFTCPFAGWWGFSALSEADYTLKGPDSSDKNVELGGVLWVYFDPVTR